jgi:hypothetical protein
MAWFLFTNQKQLIYVTNFWLSFTRTTEQKKEEEERNEEMQATCVYNKRTSKQDKNINSQEHDFGNTRRLLQRSTLSSTLSLLFHLTI